MVRSTAAVVLPRVAKDVRVELRSARSSHLTTRRRIELALEDTILFVRPSPATPPSDGK